MTFQVDKLPGNTGFRPRDVEIRLTAHGAITEGLIYEIDLTTATAAAEGIAGTSAAVDLTDPLSVVKFYCVALETVAIGETFRALVQGYTTVTVDSSGVTAGDMLAPNVNGHLATSATDGSKCVGVPPEAIAADSSGKVWFNGFGFGTIYVA